MATVSWVRLGFALAVAVPGVALAIGAVACSSSSSGAGSDGGPGGVVEASTGSEAGSNDGGSDALVTTDAGLSLRWGVALVAGNPPPPENPDGSIDLAALDGAVPEASTEGGFYTVIPQDAGFYNGRDGGSPAVVGASACIYKMDTVVATGNWTLPAQSSAYACTTTGTDGTFLLPDLPALTNMAVVISKTGYVPVVESIQTASSPMDERANAIYLYDPSTQISPPGVTVDYVNKGQIEVFDVGSDSDASAAVTMSTLADGSPPAGFGPVYQTLGGAVVPAATSFLPNKSFGTFGISLAYYYNVPAGLYTLTMVDPSDDCEPDLMPLAPRGFPLTQPKHSIQVLVMNGYLSGAVGFICTPNPLIVSTGDGG